MTRNKWPNLVVSAKKIQVLVFEVHFSSAYVFDVCQHYSNNYSYHREKKLSIRNPVLNISMFSPAFEAADGTHMTAFTRSIHSMKKHNRNVRTLNWQLYRTQKLTTAPPFLHQPPAPLLLSCLITALREKQYKFLAEKMLRQVSCHSIITPNIKSLRKVLCNKV